MQQTTDNTTEFYTIERGTKRDSYVRDLVFESTKFLSPDEAWQRIIKKSESSWAFFRATNVLFWNDLSDNILIKKYGHPEKSKIWICGDAHFENLGAQLADKKIVYTINDFDDAVIADYQYDILRFVISIFIDVEKDPRLFVRPFLESYIDTIKRSSEFLGKKPKGNLLSPVLADWLTIFEEEKKRKSFIDKLIVVNKDVIKFRLKKKLLWIRKREQDVISKSIKEIDLLTDVKNKDSFFSVKAVSKRVEGLGSFLRDRYYVLINGKSDEDKRNIKKFRVLDVKFQSEPSAFIKSEEIKNDTMKVVKNHGHRVVAAQKAMSCVTKLVMGYVKIKGFYFSVREVLPIDEKYTVDFSHTDSILQVVCDWGRVIAMAHLQAADTLKVDFADFIKTQFTSKTDIATYVNDVCQMASLYTEQIRLDFVQWSGLSEQLQDLIEQYYSKDNKNHN